MKKYDLVIVGSGASGLVAGITALENGLKNVLIIDREEQLGGNLNLFIHNDFAEKIIGSKLTGPEYATILSKRFCELGGEVKLTTEVLEVSQDKRITLINSSEGLKHIYSTIILIATGGREKFTGNVIVPKDRYTGIYTISTAHRLVNYEGYLPGKEIVISGMSKWAMVLARRLTVEGARVKAVIDISENKELNKYIDKISPFGIELINDSRITEILGEDQIEGVVVESLNEMKSQVIACDSIILSVAYAPNIAIVKGIKVDLRDNIEYPYTMNYESNIEGIFICGTAANGESIFESSDIDGRKAGLEIVRKFKSIKK